MYITWSERMWPSSWASTTRCSPGPRHCSSCESMTIIGLPEPIAWAPPRTSERDVQVVALGHVEDPADADVRGPQLGQLVLADLDRVAEEELAQRALVAPLDELAHDRVEHRHRLQRGGRGPVGGVLVRLRGDVLVGLDAVGQRARPSLVPEPTRSPGLASDQRATSPTRVIIPRCARSGRARRSPATVHEVEQRWYDTGRWPSWVDGLDRVVEVAGDWPDRGRIGHLGLGPGRPRPRDRAGHRHTAARRADARGPATRRSAAARA